MDERLAWPWAALMANIPYHNCRASDHLISLKSKGYSVTRAKPVYNGLWAFTGFAVVEFVPDWVGFESAMRLDREFRLRNRGKATFLAHDDAERDGIYGWIAGPKDFNRTDRVGIQLKKGGSYLRTVEDVQEDEHRKARILAEYLARNRAKHIGDKDSDDLDESNEKESKKQKIDSGTAKEKSA